MCECPSPTALAVRHDLTAQCAHRARSGQRGGRRKSRALRFELLDRRSLLDGVADAHMPLESQADLDLLLPDEAAVDDTASNLTSAGADEHPHPDDPVKRAEHEAVLNLVPHADATHRAVQSGSWSATSTWAGAEIPGDGAQVLIDHGFTVTIDRQELARVRWIRVDGVLRFDSEHDTELLVETIVVDPLGRLEIGTLENPIQQGSQARVVFTDSGPIDTEWDPTLISRGLISHGAASIQGWTKTSHLSLARAPAAGDSALVLSTAPRNWQLGDRILVPGIHRPTENYLGETVRDEDEIVTIVSAGPDGTTFGIDHALVYDHRPPRSYLTMYVANLSRNVVFESENQEDPQRAGHVMFMHSPNVSVQYAAFRYIGRNDKSLPTTDPQVDEQGQYVPRLDEQGNAIPENPRGRYAVHMHRTGTDSHSVVVRGAVVENNPGWGFVNHDSNAYFVENVSYNVKGAGFVTELGRELGGFVRNFAVRSRGVHYQDVFGESHELGLGAGGHGFWMQSAGVQLVDNIAAGHAQEGIFLHPTAVLENGRSDPSSFDAHQVPQGVVLPANGIQGDSVEPQQVPFRRISGNTVFASGTGIGVRWHRRPDAPTSGALGDVIENFRIWNVEWTGIQLGYAAGIIVRNGIIIGNPDHPIQLNRSEQLEPEYWANLAQGKGLMANVNSHDLRYENLWIEGFAVGILAPSSGDTMVHNVYLRNVENLRILTPQSTNEFGEEGRRIYATSVTNYALSDAELNGATQYSVYLRKQLVRPPNAGGNTPATEFRGFIDRDEIYYNGHRLHYYDQAAGQIPFRSGDVPSFMLGIDYAHFVGKTNQYLFDHWRIALGGQVASASAVDGMASGRIFGLVERGVEMPAPARPVEINALEPARHQTWNIGDGQVEPIIWRTAGLGDDTEWVILLTDDDGNRFEIGDSTDPRTGSLDLLYADPVDALGTRWWSFELPPEDVGAGVSASLPDGSYTMLICIGERKLCGFVPSLEIVNVAQV